MYLESIFFRFWEKVDTEDIIIQKSENVAIDVVM